jgi:hypothetical protein
LDETNKYVVSVSLSVKFIEDFFNIFGKNISLKITNEKLNNYLNHDRKYDNLYYDKK